MGRDTLKTTKGDRKMSDLIFEGKVMYANLPPRQAQKALEGDDTSYSVQIECTAERFAQLKKDGIPSLTQLKEFDGVTYIKLKASKLKHTKDGRVINFDDIQVVDTEGTVIEDSIANGSKVRALVELADIKGRPGKKVLRLKAVVVTDLIVYNGGNTPSSALAALGVSVKAPTKSSDSFLGE